MLCFSQFLIVIIIRTILINIKIRLIEKSPYKVKFLKNLISELNLNVEVINQNILKEPIKFFDDVIIARAFKPLNITLELIHNKAQNWKKFFIFLGKSGKNELLQASKNWDIEYKQRVSVTSSDSLVIEINRFKKK